MIRRNASHAVLFLFRLMNQKFFYSLYWLHIGWIMVLLVIYLSLTASPPQVPKFQFSDKFEHLLAYFMLMGWFGQLYPAFSRQIISALGFVLMGILLEFVQGWSGYRMFEVQDMLANTTGVLLGWWLTRTGCAGWLQQFDRLLARS